MKGLRARVNAGYLARAGGAITLLWCAALGQATPDSVSLPAPDITLLLLAGGIAAWLVRDRRR